MKYLIARAAPNLKSTVPITRLWRMATICFMLFNAPLVQSQSVETPTASLDTTPLKIGDRIPEQLWNMPLQVVNHPDDKETITLNGYRNKRLIILDLWSTWCGTCIFTLPRTFETVSKFGDDIALIPITDQSKDIVVPFIAKQKQINSIPNFYSVVSNKQYMDLFQIKWLPRAIVIDSSGVIIAVTQPKFLTEESLNKQLNGVHVDFPKVTYRNEKNPELKITKIKKERRFT